MTIKIVWFIQVKVGESKATASNNLAGELSKLVNAECWQARKLVSSSY
jgi:hypothetical protein